MEVILKENYPSLGYVGDQVNVKGGFARNFLIPRGIAVEASKRNTRVLTHLLTAINAKKVKLRGQAQEFAAKIEKITVEFTLKLGSGGKSFGSITARDVLLELEKKGIALDRRQVRLSDVVKGAGEYTADIKLHSEVVAKVAVIVKAEKVVKEVVEGEEGGEKRKRSRRSKTEEVVEDVAVEATEQ
jgi:large subunit ribosomal protein L9